MQTAILAIGASVYSTCLVLISMLRLLYSAHKAHSQLLEHIRGGHTNEVKRPVQQLGGQRGEGTFERMRYMLVIHVFKSRVF